MRGLVFISFQAAPDKDVKIMTGPSGRESFMEPHPYPKRMGELLRAICSECGFVSEDLYTGFGFKGAGDHSMEPSICPKCFSFKLRDRRHPPQMCYRCKTEVVFYGDRQFSVLFFPDPLHSETVAEEIGRAHV